MIYNGARCRVPKVPYLAVNTMGLYLISCYGLRDNESLRLFELFGITANA